MIELKHRRQIDLDYANKICDYDVVKVLNNGMLVVCDAYGQKGLINLNTKNGQGVVVLAPNYREINDFVDGLAIVSRLAYLDDYSVIDEKGQFILTASNITLLGDGYIRTNSGLFDLDGNLKTQKYKRVDRFIDGLAIVEDEFGNKGVIDQNFEVVIDLIYSELELVNDIYKGKNPTGQKKDYVLLDKQGNELFSGRYKDLAIVANDKLLVKNIYNKWKMINYKKKPLKNKFFKADHITDFQNGIGIVKENGEFLINEKMQIISETYQVLSFNPEGYVIAYDHYWHYLLNLSGEKLHQFRNYDSKSKQLIFTTTKLKGTPHYYEDHFIEPISSEVSEVKGVMDHKGNILIEPIYSGLFYINDDVYRFNNGDQNYGILYKGKEIINILVLINVLQVKDNMIVYEKILSNKKYYDLIDVSGNKIISDMEEKIFIVNENQILVNNYLVNINDLKIMYELLITYRNDTVIKQFNSWEELVNYQRKFEEIVAPLVDKEELETHLKIKKLQYESLKKVYSLINNSEHIINGVIK